MTDTNETARPGPGRPSNAARAMRTAEHEAQQAMAHAPERDPSHEQPRVRTRQRRATVNDDPFYIPQDEIPEGSSYEWKRFSNVGEENPFYIAEMRRQGWEPVDPRMHPNWLPPGYNLPHIVRGGQLLMERPIELTREAQKEQRQLSRQQLVEAEQRLGMTPKDTLTRQHKGVEPRVVAEYMRQVPIED